MGQPFNFDTPITEQTTLVARYQSDAPSGSYGGNWFRAIDADGVAYVPANLNDAVTFATSPSGNLLRESDGESVMVAANNIEELQLGGGWGGEAIDKHMFVMGSTYYRSGSNSTGQSNDPAYNGPFINLKRISGYAEGLAVGDNYTILSKGIGYRGTSLSNTSCIGGIDCTGLKFDQQQWLGLVKTIYPAGSSYIGYYSGLFSQFYVNYAVNNDDLASFFDGRGPYGLIQPLFAPPDTTSSTNLGLKWYGGVNEPTDKAAAHTATYTKGYGIVGEYAQQWVNTFNAIFPAQTGFTYFVRNTYLG